MIEVELPDGSIAEFPDGTPSAEIEAVLQRQFAPGPKDFAPTPPRQVTAPAFFEEEDVDYRTGVQDKGLRYNYAAADTPEERESVLKKAVGAGNWRHDQYGNLVISPEGLQRIGQPATRETAFDERQLTGRDLVDLGPDAPAIAGGVAAGAATGGLAGIPGALAA